MVRRGAAWSAACLVKQFGVRLAWVVGLLINGQKSLYKTGIEQTAQWLDGDDGSPLLYTRLIVESRWFGGGSSLGLMTLVYSRCKFVFGTLLLDCLVRSFAFHELIDGVRRVLAS